MWQCLTLRALNVVKQGTGRAGSGRPVRHVEAAQRVDAEVILQGIACIVAVEMPVGQGADRNAFQQVNPLAFGANQFGRGNPMQFGVQHVGLALGHAKISVGQVHPGDTRGFGASLSQYPGGGNQPVALGRQQGFISKGSGRHNTHNLAFDRSFACSRVADLFANGHRLAQSDQTCQIAFH